VQKLLVAGAKTSLYTTAPQKLLQSALHIAAEEGLPEVVKILLQAGADVHARSASLTTPLYRAAGSKSIETFSILLSAGSDITVRSWDNNTPAHEAVWRLDKEMLMKVVEAGVDMEVRNNNGFLAQDLWLSENRGIYGAVPAEDTSRRYPALTNGIYFQNTTKRHHMFQAQASMATQAQAYMSTQAPPPHTRSVVDTTKRNRHHHFLAQNLSSVGDTTRRDPMLANRFYPHKHLRGEEEEEENTDSPQPKRNRDHEPVIIQYEYRAPMHTRK